MFLTNIKLISYESSLKYEYNDIICIVLNIYVYIYIYIYMKFIYTYGYSPINLSIPVFACDQIRGIKQEYSLPEQLKKY